MIFSLSFLLFNIFNFEIYLIINFSYLVQFEMLCKLCYTIHIKNLEVFPMATFTSVYYEKSQVEANKRLQALRIIDSKHHEIKAYILREGKGKFRVLRKVEINFS